MSKTPVSTLQEYTAKHRLSDPIYTLIANSCKGSVGAFTYRVTCRSLTATGTAISKKEAKHAAAKEMLKLLRPATNFVQALQSAGGDLQKIDSYYLTASQKVSHDDIFVNSVGKLNEYCVTHKFKMPVYHDSSPSGPPHAPMFTVTCTIGNLQVNSAANSKKKAKHDAAQTMLDRLVRDTSYMKSHDLVDSSVTRTSIGNEVGFRQVPERLRILDLEIERPPVAPEVSIERAKNLYPGLNHFSGVKLSAAKQTNLNEGHLALKNFYEPLVRETALRMIERIRCSPSTVSKQGVLENVASLLGLMVDYDVITNDADVNVVVCKLNSKPVITCAGMGDTYLDARDQAIVDLIDTVDIFLR